MDYISYISYINLKVQCVEYLLKVVFFQKVTHPQGQIRYLGLGTTRLAMGKTAESASPVAASESWQMARYLSKQMSDRQRARTSKYW